MYLKKSHRLIKKNWMSLVTGEMGDRERGREYCVKFYDIIYNSLQQQQQQQQSL
jgi:hypothetical protein